MISSSELTQAIKKEAHRLGFRLAGVTTPEPPPHLKTYERWLAADRHASMEWMASDRALQRRANPRLILPECKSILVLGILYPPQPPRNRGGVSPCPPPVRGGDGGGRVASYAWGADYHDVLPDRLRAVVTFIEEKTGGTIPNRWYTDTGPILERELAQRAGLGWIGKNTNLINPKSGSYFLLAEIFLGIELIPDAPFIPDHCGSCTRCIEACPTNCILPDRTIDANRCISYLTIELKGPIPVELRPHIGDWVFGCDICQKVCPWNQRFTSHPLSPPRSRGGRKGGGGVARPSLRDELPLSPEAFNRKFKGSPIKRAKRRGYLRNVAVALGNSRNTDAVPVLAEALNDPEPLIRGHAAWALGQIGGAKAILALEAAAQIEDDDYVNTEIQQSLITLKDIEENV